jgi:hypothetical protein
MKRIFLFAVFLFLSIVFSANNSLSQPKSAVVTSKKVEYRRPDFNPSEFKSTFTVVYPRVKVSANRAIERKIQKAINYENNFEVSIQKNRLAEETDLTSLDYRIVYNKRGFLDVILFMETLGAYSWTTKKEIIFDLKTGNIAKAENCFVESSLNRLAKRVALKLRAEIERAKHEYGGFPPESENARFERENLDDFSIGNKGITFHFDYGFNYASLVLQPKGEFFFSWKQIRPFVRRDGLLAKFVRF